MTRLAQIPFVLVLPATSLLLVGCGGSSRNNKDVGITDGPSVASDVPNALSIDTSPELAPTARADGLVATPDAIADDRQAEIEVGETSDVAGTTPDATLEDALVPRDGAAPDAEWACGTQTCHTGQVCFHAISGAVGSSNPPPYCEDLQAGCSDACCVCRDLGGMCEGGGLTDVTCGMP